MSAEPAEEKTELEILEEKLKKLETLSVREESDAARSCQHLITVVMCTFAPPKLAVVMNAMLTFPEKTKVSTKDLSTRMQLDKKQMREKLANLKSMGYILETTGVTEWAQQQKQKQKNYNSRYGRDQNFKAAQYHIDYQYFIMMTKFRLHSILKRLNAQQKKEDDMGGGYVCCNEQCFLVYKIKKVMDLIYEQQNSAYAGRVSNQSHFVCSECGNALVDAQKYWNNQNATLTRTMTFNLQMQSLRRLLSETEKKVTLERIRMGTEISKLEDQMVRIKNGSGHNVYKAMTLNVGDSKMKNGRRGTGLAHLDRIGRRSVVQKDFLCKIEGNDGEGKDKGSVTVKDEKESVEFDKQFQKDVRTNIQMIRDNEILRQMSCDKNGNGNGNGCAQNGCNELHAMVEVKVSGVSIKLSDILDDIERYEAKMSTQEWNAYQETLDGLGLLEIE